MYLSLYIYLYIYIYIYIYTHTNYVLCQRLLRGAAAGGHKRQALRRSTPQERLHTHTHTHTLAASDHRSSGRSRIGGAQSYSPPLAGAPWRELPPP